MLKLGLCNETILRKMQSFPLHFFECRIDCIQKIQDDALYDYHYSRIILPQNIHKTTYANRFLDADQITLTLLQNKKDVRVHDIAVSSAITSLELYLSIKEKNIPCTFYISDKYANFYSNQHGLIHTILDDDGQAIHYYLFSVLASPQVSWLYPISRGLFYILNYLLGGINKNYLHQKSPCLSYHRKVLAHFQPGVFEAISYDIFYTQMINSFSYVRAMNILSLVYFNEEQIKKALDNIILSLREDGILQVGKTSVYGKNDVSYFRKQNQRLIHLQDLNQGSEIKSLCLDFPFQ